MYIYKPTKVIIQKVKNMITITTPSFYLKIHPSQECWSYNWHWKNNCRASVAAGWVSSAPRTVCLGWCGASPGWVLTAGPNNVSRTRPGGFRARCQALCRARQQTASVVGLFLMIPSEWTLEQTKMFDFQNSI